MDNQQARRLSTEEKLLEHVNSESGPKIKTTLDHIGLENFYT